MSTNRFLASGFLNSANNYPDNNALFVQNSYIKYRELFELSLKIAATIQKYHLTSNPKLTAVFAYRSISAFSGILGSLLAGHGYVPLNLNFPLERTKYMLVSSECKSIILDIESAKHLNDLIEGISYPLLLIFPDLNDVSNFINKWPIHKIIGKNDFEKIKKWQIPIIDIDDIAYLLFTSGSTGTPKGVQVSHKNVIAYIDYMTCRYEVTENDRFSQTFDMTFDLSVFDIFMAWGKGACVYCPSKKELFNPTKYIKNNQITIWFSVPSLAFFMKRLKLLKKDNFPSLRLSLFCGEALPENIITDWKSAAPYSIIENLYGPTELTISCTYYRWDDKISPFESYNGLVPIGYPNPEMEFLVVDDKFVEVSVGNSGELLMTGPQLTKGYWNDHQKTSIAFIIPPSKNKVYYRTGDLVIKPENGKPLLYIGRIDSQIQVLGHRVELGEIESVIREQSGITEVVALGWPITSSGANGVIVFIGRENIDVSLILKKISLKLPDYMTPKKIYTINQIPLNVNGKFDRKALINLLKEK